MGLYARLSNLDAYEFTSLDALLYKRFQICDRFKWTVQEYNSTPASIIAQFWAFIKTEAKARDDRNNDG